MTSVAWQRVLDYDDVEVLAALDAAIQRAEEVRDVTEWPEGFASARLTTRHLDPTLLAFAWGAEAVSRRLTQLSRRDLVAVEPGFPALFTLTPMGDTLIAEREAELGES